MQPPDDTSSQNPLSSLGDWDDDVRNRYQEGDSDQSKGFRDYGDQVRDSVREFYRQNHIRQTVEFVRSAHEKYLPLRTRRMGIWQAMEYLNELVDDSDPDTELPQIIHAVQTAEAIRAKCCVCLMNLNGRLRETRSPWDAAIQKLSSITSSFRRTRTGTTNLIKR